MAIDVNQLETDILGAASGVLDKDVSTLEGFAQRQVKALAQQAALVEAGIATKQITEETREFFLKSLQDMARNFAKALVGLVEVMIEKVWNAVVSVIWKAIEAGTGVKLPSLA